MGRAARLLLPAVLLLLLCCCRQAAAQYLSIANFTALPTALANRTTIVTALILPAGSAEAARENLRLCGPHADPPPQAEEG